MDRLYVAWQDEKTREWIPVAMLGRLAEGYTLQYTQGAKRCKSFAGLGRMSALDKVYFSETLFPFFANRLVSRSRPEYKNFMKWLALDEIGDDPMAIMAVTGGVRATDSFELVPVPRRELNFLKLDFFVRGLRHLPNNTLERIASLSVNDRLYLMGDVQNLHDQHALMLRTDDPKTLIGYVPRYYCSGLDKLLASDPGNVVVNVKRVNPDAPLDMRLLCSLSAPWTENFELLESESDFQPLGSGSGNLQVTKIALPGELHLGE